MTILLSQHSKERLKERIKLKGGALDNNAQQAWDKGKTVDQFEGHKKKYLSNVLKRSSGQELRVFRNCVFLFGVQNEVATLITSFPLDNKILHSHQRGHYGKIIQ